MASAKVLLGHGTQLSYSSGNDFMKRNVFNCFLKEKREVAVVNEHASMLAECMVHIV